MSILLEHKNLAFVFITVGSFLLSIIVLILCLFRRKMDENSMLISSSSHSGTDFSTSQIGYDHALMSCQYYIRHTKRLEFLQSYKQADKESLTYFFSVRDKELAGSTGILTQSKNKCVLKVICRPKLSTYVRDCDDSVAGAILDILLTIKGEVCPYLFPVLDLKYQKDRETLLVLNQHVSNGSLRDQMRGMKPFKYSSKTLKAKEVEYGKGLTLEKICIYTKQMLLGLIFMDKIRFPLKKTHLWLHAGNLYVDQGICKLSGYEMELMRLRSRDMNSENENRAGLNSVAQIVFEMATGFPINYAENTTQELKKKLSLKRKESLKTLHFDYLKTVCRPEIFLLVQFLSDPEKCVSLHASIHHPFFDQLSKFNPIEPENSTIMSVRTLMNQIQERSGVLNDGDIGRTSRV